MYRASKSRYFWAKPYKQMNSCTGISVCPVLSHFLSVQKQGLILNPPYFRIFSSSYLEPVPLSKNIKYSSHCHPNGDAIRVHIRQVMRMAVLR